MLRSSHTNSQSRVCSLREMAMVDVVVISSDSESDPESTASSSLNPSNVVFTPTKRPPSPDSAEEDIEGADR